MPTLSQGRDTTTPRALKLAGFKRGELLFYRSGFVRRATCFEQWRKRDIVIRTRCRRHRERAQ